MKLHEIHLRRQHTTKLYKISDFDSQTKILVGRGEGGLLIYKQTSPKDKIAALYTLENHNMMLSGVIGYFFPHNNIQYFKIIDVFTPPEQQMKGYATALYTALVKKYKFKLMSAAEQTPNGKKLWNSIQKTLNVKVLDAETDQILSKDNISDEDIYVNQPNRYLLIAEQTYLNENHRKLMEPSLVGDFIVDDYLNYTHIENEGKYP
ncbi:MAG: hypothetical protein ACREAU_00125 [Nitrosopumilaceae archaeon]